MTAGKMTITIALLFAALTNAVHAAGLARDWSANPVVVERQNIPEIDAVGDLHGDYDKAVKLFVGAGLLREAPATPEAAQWAGGKIVLVCTGDMIDKWTKSVEVLRLMRALQASARQAGGDIVVMLGNHEAEFLAAGGKNKKASEFEEELRGSENRSGAACRGRMPRGLVLGCGICRWPRKLMTGFSVMPGTLSGFPLPPWESLFRPASPKMASGHLSSRSRTPFLKHVCIPFPGG